MKGATIRRMAMKALIFAKKAVPYVLAAVSAAGTVAVTVEAVKEIKKNTPVVENQEETVKEKVVRNIKTYWKPITFGVGSITCQAASVFIFTKRQQRLVIATHQMETLLRRYADAANATAVAGGAAVANKLTPSEYPSTDDTPFDTDADSDGLTLFWDPIFDYWFRADERDFLRAAKDTSHSFAFYGVETAENFYLRMGVDPPIDKDGNEWIGWGWYMNDDWVNGWAEYSGYIDIDFSNIRTMDDGLEYREVCYFQEPYFDMDIADCAIKVH